MKKAFDTVVHDILIEKLGHYGVRRVAKDCFVSYLRRRRQFLVIEQEASATQKVFNGVLQGSILGPLLFPIYISGLNTCIQFLHEQKPIKSIVWLSVNKLCLNIQKIKLMIFSPTSFKIYASIKFQLHGKRLIPVQSVKYLAVLLDRHLQWTEQLSNVKIKFNRAIDILSKLRHTSNLNILKITYQSLFCSHFPYAC